MSQPDLIELHGKSVPVIPFPSSLPTATPFVRRRLSPMAGRALEVLGHAIEYLADEYASSVADNGPLGSAHPRVEAIQILKKLNREVYYAGTEVPTLFTRVRSWLLGEKPQN